MLHSGSKEAPILNITKWALKRAIMLIREIAGGKISSDIIDVYPNEIKNTTVEVNYNNINRLIGKKIDPCHNKENSSASRY